MSKTFKAIWNVCTTVLVIILVTLAVLLVGVRLFGLRTYAVLSGSMEPSYKTGSLIYIKRTDPEDIKVRDVITFVLPGDKVATHRVVGITKAGEAPNFTYSFQTKGDANDEEDVGSVRGENVLGVVVVSKGIPLLGYLANYIQRPPGIYVALAVGGVILLLLFLPDLFWSEKGKRRGAEAPAGTAPEEGESQGAPDEAGKED